MSRMHYAAQHTGVSYAILFTQQCDQPIAGHVIFFTHVLDRRLDKTLQCVSAPNAGGRAAVRSDRAPGYKYLYQ